MQLLFKQHYFNQSNFYFAMNENVYCYVLHLILGCIIHVYMGDRGYMLQGGYMLQWWHLWCLLICSAYLCSSACAQLARRYNGESVETVNDNIFRIWTHSYQLWRGSVDQRHINGLQLQPIEVNALILYKLKIVGKYDKIQCKPPQNLEPPPQNLCG